MRHPHAVLAVIALLGTPDRAFAQDAPYEWTISDSNVDPYVNTDTTTGFHSVYLWLQCSNYIPGIPQIGMSAAEFAIVTSPPGANLHVATNMQNGFLNAGTVTNLLLAVGGCPAGPVVAANLLVIFNVPGTIALAPSSTQTKGTVDCSQNPSLWPIDWVGLGVLGLPTPSKGQPFCTHKDYFCFYCHPVTGCEFYLSGSPCPPPNNCDDCPPTAVDATSWGSTKARYHD